MARFLGRIASVVLISQLFCDTNGFDIRDLFQRTELKRVKRTASCSIDNGGCDINCEETPLGAQCSCPKGFIPRQDGRSCEDINECETDNGGCESNCHNNHGSYRCSCPPGFKLNADERTCRDFNECSLNNTCAHSCTNTIGSYVCSCNDGYIQYVTGRCGDIDECVDHNGGCEHTCVNTQGSYKCSCNEGYAVHWNGRDCTKVDRYSPISEIRNGKLTIVKSQGVNKIWLECYGKHTFAYNALAPSFHYSCGDPSDERSLQPSSYPWITRYSRSNHSVPRGENVVIVKKTIEANTKGCTFSGLRRFPFGSRGVQFNILNFNVSCTAKSSNRRRRTRYFLRLYIKVLATVRRKPGKTRKRVNKLLRAWKKVGKNNHQFHLRFPNIDAEFGRKSKETMSDHIPSVFDSGRGNYKTCPKGSAVNFVTNSCINCSTGQYQDGVGKVKCIECPLYTGSHDEIDISMEASNRYVHSCPGVCRPGYYSKTGLEPCQPCPENTYQPYHGRVGCYECGTRNMNHRLASTSFMHCSVRGTCTAGHYYDVRLSSCNRCPKGFYQSELGKNFCNRCPPGTTTDMDASTGVDACKSHECVRTISNIQGYIESPNYPGDYPTNVECRWTILPPRGRKLLLVIPEIHLRSEDGCGDRLSIYRKSGGRGSRPVKIVTELSSCQTSLIPQTVTPRAKKLVIDFTSDDRNTAKGFRIPYVTYDENYENVISDIVSDSRLFSISYHQDILKDETSRQTLLNVLANPRNYFALRKRNFGGLFRKAFIAFLQDKVVTFLNRPTS